MKLLLNQDLYFTWKATPETAASDIGLNLDYYRDLQKLAKTFALSSRFVFGESDVRIEVLAQKITLDEIAMNALFVDFFQELFSMETRVTPLGGSGCQFAFEVVAARALIHA